MKITIITSPFGYLPPNGYGAVEYIWYNVSQEFIKKGHTISFISKKFNYINNKSPNGLRIIGLKGYHRTGSIINDLLLDLIFSLKALWKLENTDILIMNTFWSPILSIFFKRKFKITAYNVARFPKHQFKFYKHIDRLYCVSTSVYKVLVTQTPYAIKQAKIISNPIDDKIFFYKKKSNSDIRTIRVIYSGRVHPEKGLIILVNAINYLISKYQNLELVIIGTRSIKDGGGGEVYLNELNKNATNFDIIYLDPVSDRSLLKDEITKSDIFCYPSIAERGETFGVAPLEAMATGTATILSNLDCFKDFVADGINGLVFDHRAENAVSLLAEKIEQLILDSEFRDKLAMEGSKTALNFSNEKIANEYLKDFEELLSKKKYA